MGDSTCVLQPFSYTSSAISHESKQGNPLLMHGLGDSVSFGRFMTESLAWEKWSTFSSSSSSSSHNRYVEEAERYAQPGSVAQKKAFFEAHYKRIAAAKKAAADAAAAAAATTTDSTHAATAEPAAAVTNHPAPPLPPPPPPPAAAVSEVEINGVDSKLENSGLVGAEAKVEMALDAKEDSTETSTLIPESLENQGMMAPAGSEENPQIIEKPLLLLEQKRSSDQEAPPLVKSKKKSAFSTLKSSVYRKTPRTPAKQPSTTTPINEKQDNSNVVNYNATTPILRKKQALDFTDKKQNCTPKKSSPVKQLRNLLSPGRKANNSRKADNSSSRIAPDSSSSKMSQNYATPKMEKAAKLPNSDASMATPWSANTRAKTPGDGSKTTGPKWNMFTAVYSKSLTACRNKLQSPTLSSTPFLLRTEERAARRKQKLEDKFNSKDVEKVQLQQTSLKEKAELELRKLRQSFCFKARPLPDFYKEREVQAQNNQIKKVCSSVVITLLTYV
ncbi:OLC1v1011763C2 [Oldenlandia corymbosa var. corymbosa]|uniref:OLC1v1011763C2 n=1 Tax=Oldenlandia corymbosa var. corymbosa TaxID=529605 RepID=A0AAV1DXF7_OLDCO|nr:OLC1v1011763C2 [Oldenlandia corymbosa var. corymbosa]